MKKEDLKESTTETIDTTTQTEKAPEERNNEKKKLQKGSKSISTD